MAVTMTLNVSQAWNLLPESRKNQWDGYDGFSAVFEHMEDLSDSIGEDIDFDPVSWAGDLYSVTNYQDALGYTNDTEVREASGEEPEDWDEMSDDEKFDVFVDNAEELGVEIVATFDGGVIVQAQ